MEQEKQQYFRRLLEKERQELMERLAHLEDPKVLNSLQDSTSELSMFDNHPADLGTETFERSKEIGLRDLIKSQLADNKVALKKIENGNYGRCEECGRKIPEERLEVVPSAPLCLECQMKKEVRVKFYRRPVEEGVVMPPFGGFPEDRLFYEQSVEFDGEDSWQAVARYGTSSDVVKSEMGFSDNEMGEDVGGVEDVESIPCYRDSDGVICRDYRGKGNGRILEEENF
ncbi:MAG: TraR/DksA C4-type zinc finger protein [Thermacetogeniaceae bacterium]